jgi:hypothetical protein
MDRTCAQPNTPSRLAIAKPNPALTPATVAYECLKMFVSKTGRPEHVKDGESLPAGSRRSCDAQPRSVQRGGTADRFRGPDCGLAARAAAARSGAHWHRATTVFANTPAMPSSSRADEWNERSGPYLRRNAARCRWAVPVSVRLEAIWPSPYRRALRAA